MADTTRSGPHVGHDLALVAAAAAGDLAGPDLQRAQAQLAACRDCAELAADLRAIQVVTRGLPSAFDEVRASAPRDFRLTVEDATRLSRRVPGLGSIGWPRGSRAWARRFGGALLAFGLVGLLVSAAPLRFLGGAAGASAPTLESAPSSAPTAGAYQGFNSYATSAPAAGSTRAPQGDSIGTSAPGSTAAPQGASTGTSAPGSTAAPQGASSGTPAPGASVQADRSSLGSKDASAGDAPSTIRSPDLGTVVAFGSGGAILVGAALLLATRRSRRDGS